MSSESRFQVENSMHTSLALSCDNGGAGAGVDGILTSPTSKDCNLHSENTVSTSNRKRKRSRKKKATKKRRKHLLICRHDDCFYRAKELSILHKHDRTHSDLQPFSCRICSNRNTARTKDEMLTHIEQKHKAIVVMFKRGYGGRDTLMRHADIDQKMLNKEAEQIDQWLASEECRLKAGVAEDDESLESLCARLEELELKYKFECRLDPDGCQWLFASEGDRLTHEREHLGIEAYVCQWPVESGTNDNFTEGICGRRFLRAQFTREHIKAEHCSAELQEDHYIEQFVWEDEELLATS